MARFSGKIGFAVTEETEPGVFEPVVHERQYYGEIVRLTKRYHGSNVIEDVTIGNEVSVVADPYAYDNLHTIRYVKFMGATWKVTNIVVERPRLILTVGGVYNGNQT